MWHDLSRPFSIKFTRGFLVVFSPISEFSPIMPPPLRLAASESPPRPRPPNRHPHDRLAAGFLFVPLTAIDAAAIAGSNEVFIVVVHRRHPFGRFPATGTAAPVRPVYPRPHPPTHARVRQPVSISPVNPTQLFIF